MMRTQRLISLMILTTVLVGCGLQQKALENRQQQEATSTKTTTPTSTPGTTTSAPVDLDTGLILFMRFEDGGGTAEDLGIGNDGLIQGTVDVVGKKGSALLFNNYQDKVLVPFSSYYNFTKITVSTWVYWNGMSGYDQRIFQRSSNVSATNSAYNLRVDSNARAVVDLTINGSNVSFNTSVPLSVGRWIHLAYTYDGNRVSFYKDGQFAGSLVAIGNLGGYPLNNTLVIGNAAEAIRPFNGAIDEFMIYNRALSDAEIEALYQLKK